MSKFLEWFDQFGALFQLKIFNQDHEFRSPYGGFVSLLIYTSITLYSVYQAIQWQTKEIPPTVVTMLNYVPEGMYLNMTSRLFTLSIENDHATDELHQIEKKGYLYNVEGIYYGMNNVIKPLKMNPENYSCGSEKTHVDFFRPICLNPEEPDQKWFYQDVSRLNDVYFDYSVTFCDPKIDHGCLSKKDSAQFFNEDTNWRLTTIIQDVNLQTGEIFDIPTDYFYLIDANKSLYIQMKVVKAVLSIDDGFIFPDVRVIEIVKEVKIQVSDGPPSANPGPFLSISMERYQIELEIQFVKLAAIIADVTSWLQTLLVLGYFLSVVNNDLLYQRVKDALLKMYFPQCRKYSLKYNWRKNLEHVSRDGQILSKEQAQQYIDFRKRMFSAIEMQFNQLHILSQINKMQIALQLLLPKETIRNLRNIDYLMKVERCPTPSCSDNQHNYSMDEDDFLVFQQLSSMDSKVHPFDDEIRTPKENDPDNPTNNNIIFNLGDRITQNKPSISVTGRMNPDNVCLEDIE